MNIGSSQVVHRLDKGYKITKISGSDCKMMLRDKYSTPLAVIELCGDKVSNVRGYKSVTYDNKYRKILVDYVRDFHYRLTEDAAVDLGLSVVKTDGEEDVYLTGAEFSTSKLEEYMRRPEYVSITFNDYEKNVLTVPSGTKNCSLNLTHASVKKLIVEKKANVSIDLRDNQYTETLYIKDNFKGRLNLSRCNLEEIQIADNCRCDILFNYSGKCFDMIVGDVFSGVLDIRNSCFHNLEIGYYCYADIKLSENWGGKSIFVGDSFRGTLNADSVVAKSVHIGNDCRGKINISSKDNRCGLKSLEVDDDFNGELNLRHLQTIETVSIGAHAAGRVDLVACPSVRAVRIEEGFNGIADFSSSGLMYLQAQKKCRGRFVLMHCDNLSLLKLPRSNVSEMKMNTSPLEISKDKEYVYYKFDEREIPGEYQEGWLASSYRKIKKVMKRNLPA